jgi:hypothetical protein
MFCSVLFGLAQNASYPHSIDITYTFFAKIWWHYATFGGTMPRAGGTMPQVGGTMPQNWN